MFENYGNYADELLYCKNIEEKTSNDIMLGRLKEYRKIEVNYDKSPEDSANESRKNILYIVQKYIRKQKNIRCSFLFI